MKPRCEDELNAHAGRALTVAEKRGIEDRLAYHFRQTQAEASGNGWSTGDALREAAVRARTEFGAETAKEAQRVALKVTTAAEKAGQYAEAKATWGPTKALGRVIENSSKKITGVKQVAFAKIVDTIESAEPRFLKAFENPEATRDFVQELFGNDTGNQVAKRGAEAWIKGTEELRLRANRAGFNIGKLGYSYIPQPHDVVAMLKAGKEAWTAKIVPRLDRSRYLQNDGSLMTDAQVSDVMRGAYDTITTNGWNKIDPTDFQGSGSRANRGSAHRAIHFDGADSYLAHMAEFGRGTVWDAMKSHVDGTAGSIGLVEEFGPSPQSTFDLLQRTAIKDNAGVQGSYGIYHVDPAHQFAAASGATSHSVNVKLAEINQAVRNLQVATKLGSTFLGAGNDMVTIATTALFNDMPVMRTIGSIFSTMGNDSKRFAAEAGLAVNSIVGDMNTFAAGNAFGNGWTSKLANGIMKASFLEGWTNALKRGFAVSMMHTLADLTKTDWDALAPRDRARLVDGGVRPEDWAIWQRAPRQQFDGGSIIHHDDIAAMAASGSDASVRAHDRAASALLGWIASESDAALVIPDNYTSAALTRGLQKGTVAGEIERHVALFKGYSAALGHRYLERIADLDMSKAGKAGLYVAFAATMTMMGALGMQLKSIAQGKDPVDMTGPHAGNFWTTAAFQGGGSGIMGDVVQAATKPGMQQYSAIGDLILGPTVGTATAAAQLTLGEAGKGMRGEKTDLGANALRFVRGNTPLGAPLNLWYTKQAVDHMFFHELQERASPGYLGRMQQRTQKDMGQSYWWRPGPGTPQRAPDLDKALGDK